VLYLSWGNGLNINTYVFLTQVFLKYIETLPQEEVKVLIGDNLASHLSPSVLELCEAHNIRFVFLPENSTHLLQPLDVAVFGPMKKRWRQVLTEWKEKDAREGINRPSIPKEVINKFYYKELYLPYYTDTGRYRYGTVPSKITLSSRICTRFFSLVFSWPAVNAHGQGVWAEHPQRLCNNRVVPLQHGEDPREAPL
jgi:hypothetical protein